MKKIFTFLLCLAICASASAFWDHDSFEERPRLNQKFVMSSHKFVERFYLNVALKTKMEIRDEMTRTRDHYRDLAIEEINKAEMMMDEHFNKAIKAIYNTAFDVMLSSLWDKMCVLVVARDIGKGESSTFKDVIINYFEFRNQLDRIDERIDMYNWCQEALDYMDTL